MGATSPDMSETEKSAGATPAPTPAADTGGRGPASGGNGEALRATHESVVSKHAGKKNGRFSAGGTPWNKGRRLAVEDGAPSVAGPVMESGVSPAAGDAVSPAPPLVDKETVRRLVELGLNALDERLQIHMASGWFALTGDKNLALQQAQFYALKQNQREAIGLAASLCAEKYSGLLEYMPEAALLVTAGTYGVTWLVGFNKLKQAALLKAREQKKVAEPAPMAPTAATAQQ